MPHAVNVRVARSSLVVHPKNIWSIDDKKSLMVLIRETPGLVCSVTDKRGGVIEFCSYLLNEDSDYHQWTKYYSSVARIHRAPVHWRSQAEICRGSLIVLWHFTYYGGVAESVFSGGLLNRVRKRRWFESNLPRTFTFGRVVYGSWLLISRRDKILPKVRIFQGER